MNPERWSQLKEIFLTAQDLEPVQREIFLQEVCKEDAAMRIDVETLLASSGEALEFFDGLDEIRKASITRLVSALQPGDQIRHYRVLCKIGHGGMGEVYKAEDLKLGRLVAIKVLPSAIAREEKFHARLLREARAASNLSHPNIVTIYSIEEIEGLDSIVMEYVEGETLRSLIQRGPLELSKLIHIALQVTEGLSAAHSSGLVHRDIKPENILITTREQIKILDFGVAKMIFALADESNDLTGPGVIAGTVSYMSPEQTRGEPLDARSDIFSLGCVLYEAVTGKAAYSGPNVLSILHQIASGQMPQSAVSIRSDLPPAFDQLLQRAMQPVKEQRYATATEMAEDLIRLQSDNVTPLRKHGVQFRRTAGFVFFLLLLMFGILWYSSSQKAQQVRTLAVLPLTNASVNPNVQYLSDGITESIINHLSQMTGFRVTASSMVFKYKGKEYDPRKVAQDLNVDAVITGSVIQHADLLVFQIDMMKVSDGSQIWGAQYTRKISDVMTLQPEISKNICQELQHKLETNK